MVQVMLALLPALWSSVDLSSLRLASLRAGRADLIPWC
jgi:hypothetical protein